MVGSTFLGEGAVSKFGSFVVALVAALGIAHAQCNVSWVGNGAVAGVDGTVEAFADWDPDGAGPEPAVVVAGGTFTVAGSVLANNVACYDPVANTWSALGAGCNGKVRAIVAMPNGDLVIGGDFTAAGGVGADRLARWNGSVWAPMGLTLQPGSNSVRALKVDPAGDLLVAGWFAVAGLNATGVARWDGQTWSAFPGASAQVNDLAALPTGGFVVAGWFSIQGTSQHGVAVWNGSAWSFLGSGLVHTSLFEVRRVCVLANGDIVAAGAFPAIGGVNVANIARWDGTTWQPVGNGLPVVFLVNGIYALSADVNGDLLAGGTWFATPGSAPHKLWRWDGATWSPVGGGALAELPGTVNAVHRVAGGDLLVGGSLTTPPSFPSRGVARWDGAHWHPAGIGTSGVMQDALALPNGDLVVTGSMSSIGGVPVDHVALWSGGQWSALGGGLPQPAGRGVVRHDGHVFVLSGWGATTSPFSVAEWNGTTWLPHFVGWSQRPTGMVVMPNGDVVFAGEFTMAAGVAATSFVRYDGSTWSPLGVGAVLGAPHPLRDGGLVVTTPHNVRHWDGSSWRVLGGIFDRPAGACLELPNGDLVVGGSFQQIDDMPARAVARWDGQRWWPMGDGFTGQLDQFGTYVAGLSLRPDGSVLAVGSFTQSGYTPSGPVYCRGVARWHGGSWSGLGAGTNGTVTGAHELPGGDLLITGNFTMAGGVPANRVARWNGANWTAFGGGLDKAPSRVVPLATGDFAFVGDFAIADGQVSAAVAWLRSSCPASATPSGAGCTGSAGPVTLAATRLPWLGDTFAARTNGIAPASVGVLVWGGGATQLPLANVLPIALPGCELLVVPDTIELALPSAAVVDSSLAIPSSSSLLGQSLRHQVVLAELGVGTLTAITASNALQLTIGSF